MCGNLLKRLQRIISQHSQYSYNSFLQYFHGVFGIKPKSSDTDLATLILSPSLPSTATNWNSFNSQRGYMHPLRLEHTIPTFWNLPLLYLMPANPKCDLQIKGHFLQDIWPEALHLVTLEAIMLPLLSRPKWASHLVLSQHLYSLLKGRTYNCLVNHWAPITYHSWHLAKICKMNGHMNS